MCVESCQDLTSAATFFLPRCASCSDIAVMLLSQPQTHHTHLLFLPGSLINCGIKCGQIRMGLSAWELTLLTIGLVAQGLTIACRLKHDSLIILYPSAWFIVHNGNHCLPDLIDNHLDLLTIQQHSLNPSLSALTFASFQTFLGGYLQLMLMIGLWHGEKSPMNIDVKWNSETWSKFLSNDSQTCIYGKSDWEHEDHKFLKGSR